MSKIYRKIKKIATDDDDDDKENDVPKMSALEFLGNKEGLERIELERKHLREINAKINHMVECRLSSIQITQDQIDAEVRRYWLECQEDNIPKRPRIQIRKKDRDFAYNRLFLKEKKKIKESCKITVWSEENNHLSSQI